MSIHVSVCQTCRRSIPVGGKTCRHCVRAQSESQSCKSCGAKMKRAMLRCRECGTSADGPSQRKSGRDSTPTTITAVRISSQIPQGNSVTLRLQECPQCGSELRPGMVRCRDCGQAVNSELKTEIGGRQAVTSTGTDRLTKATNSQPIDQKPSPIRRRPPFSSTKLAIDAKSSTASKDQTPHANVPQDSMTGWSGLVSLETKQCSQKLSAREALLEAEAESRARKQKPQEEFAPRQPQVSSPASPASEIIERNQRSVVRQNSSAPPSALAPAVSPLVSSPSVNNRKKPLIVKNSGSQLRRPVNWRVLGILGGSIAGFIVAVTVATQVFSTERDPAPIAATAKRSADSELERAAATWVLAHYGVVTVKAEDGKNKRYVALEHLPAEPFTVTEINLYGQEFDEGGLSFLPQLADLRKLDLSATAVGKTGLNYVGRVTTLKSLSVRGNRCSPELYRLLQNGGQIQSCTVSGSKVFDDTAMDVISQTMPNLRTLSVGGTSVSDEGLNAASRLRSLSVLTISKLKVTDAAIKELQLALPACSIRK